MASSLKKPFFVCFFLYLHWSVLFSDFGERERENIDRLSPVCDLTRDQTCIPGRCPDRASNLEPFSVQDNTPTKTPSGGWRSLSWIPLPGVGLDICLSVPLRPISTGIAALREHSSLLGTPVTSTLGLGKILEALCFLSVLQSRCLMNEGKTISSSLRLRYTTDFFTSLILHYIQEVSLTKEKWCLPCLLYTSDAADERK